MGAPRAHVPAPAGRDRSLSPHTLPPTNRRRGALAHAFESIRVLLAQDHPEDVKRVRACLEADLGTHVAVEHVSTLRDATDLLRQRYFDAVLIDVGLPDANGVACVRALDEIEGRPPALVLSGRCDEELAMLAVRQGAQDCVALDQLYPGVLGRSVLQAIERHRHSQRLYEIARSDSLTGLSNRHFFLDRTRHAVELAQQEGGKLALLFLDVDRLKAVNDGLGHAAGDELLCEIARRIEGVLRMRDTVALLRAGRSSAARLGGDEFAVLLVGIADREAADGVVRRLARTLADPVSIGRHTCATSTSIGCALYPDDADSAEGLLRHADDEMYRAKRHGRSIDPRQRKQHGDARARLRLENDLSGALAREEFVLCFQPQLALTGARRVLGVEALLRWRRGDQRLALPGEFMHVLNDSDLIQSVGHWVLDTACQRVIDFQRTHPDLEPLRIAVNVSAHQLTDGTLTQHVRSSLERSGLEPARLELEIVEDALLHPQAAATLAEIGALGVRIALDDFGTGYSSLTHLRDIAVDTLKLDRSFVKNMERSPRDAEIARGVIEFAKRLHLETVAEGVETPEQLHMLVDAGCDCAQGFLLGKPQLELPNE